MNWSAGKRQFRRSQGDASGGYDAGSNRQLPFPKPMTLEQKKASPEWLQWKGAVDIEMAGLVKTMMWDQVPRPINNKLVVGTKILYKRKKNKRGEVEK